MQSICKAWKAKCSIFGLQFSLFLTPRYRLMKIKNDDEVPKKVSIGIERYRSSSITNQSNWQSDQILICAVFRPNQWQVVSSFQFFYSSSALISSLIDWLDWFDIDQWLWIFNDVIKFLHSRAHLNRLGYALSTRHDDGDWQSSSLHKYGGVTQLRTESIRWSSFIINTHQQQWTAQQNNKWIKNRLIRVRSLRIKR